MKRAFEIARIWSMSRSVSHSQREVVPKGQCVYLTGAWNDNGRGMAGFVERVCLDDEYRPLFLAWLLVVRLRPKTPLTGQSPSRVRIPLFLSAKFKRPNPPSESVVGLS